MPARQMPSSQHGAAHATDVMGQERRALEDPAARVYDIIAADGEGDEPRP